MPVVEWRAMVDGFQASVEGTSSEAPEPEGDLHLETIKRWLSKRSYSEKLTAVLMWQLVTKESAFEKPDNSIGNDFFHQWEDEIVTNSGDPKYLENAPVDEAAVTSATTIMLPWKV